MLDLILLVLGLICFALATIGVQTRVNLTALGLLFVFARGLIG